MRGISEERLRQFRNDFADRSDKRLMEYVIREGCQELNQWMPIESAPKDREIIVAGKDVDIHFAIWHERSKCFIARQGFRFTVATHWMELPTAPELPEPPSGN